MGDKYLRTEAHIALGHLLIKSEQLLLHILSEINLLLFRKLPSSVCMGIYMTPKEKSGVFLGSMEPLDRKQIDHIASCLPNIIVPQVTNIACLYTIDFAGNLSVRAPPSVGTSSAHATPEVHTTVSSINNTQLLVCCPMHCSVICKPGALFGKQMFVLLGKVHEQ